jgi:hypothetical protein
VAFYGPATLLVYLHGADGPSARATLARLREEFAESLRGGELFVGISTFPAHGSEVERLVEQAEAALGDARGERGWWTLLLSGVAGVLAGLAAFMAPALTAMVLLYVMAGWAVVTGALEIAAAIRLRREIQGEGLMALSGVLSVAFGVLVMVAPLAGALAVVCDWYAARGLPPLAALAWLVRQAPPRGGGYERSQLAIEAIAQQLSGAVQSLAIWWREHPNVKREYLVDCVMDFAWLGLERVRAGERIKG